MENNKANFEKFVGQYIGQSMIVTKSNFYPIDAGRVFMINRGCWDYVTNPKLKLAVELKSLADISNKDLIQLAKILSYSSDEIKIKRRESEIWCVCDENIKVVLGTVKFGLFAKMIDGEPSENNNKFSEPIIFHENEMVCAIDYLRSQGYLIPFGELPTEELIVRGWAKIKSNA